VPDVAEATTEMLPSFDEMPSVVQLIGVTPTVTVHSGAGFEIVMLSSRGLENPMKTLKNRYKLISFMLLTVFSVSS
jgi:hypothetical protein